MIEELSSEEMQRILGYSPEERYTYFIEKTRETKGLWTLASDESLLVLGSEEQEQFVILWPLADFALKWFEDSELELEEVELVNMDLTDWLESTFEELAEANIMIRVCPGLEDEGVDVDPKTIAAQLQA